MAANKKKTSGGKGKKGGAAAKPTAAEREQQKTEARAKQAAHLARLEQAVAAIKSSDDWRRYLKVQASFHAYSLNNLLMIMTQCPDATRVAGFKTWQSLGRQVRKGEKGIAIFCPRPFKTDRIGDDGEPEVGLTFRLGHVFDISQTDGDELTDVAAPVLTADEGAEGWAALVAFAAERGLTVEERDPGGSPERMGFYSRSKQLIVVRPQARSMMVKVLAHELAHAIDPDLGTSGDEEREVVAESSAYVVCAHFGIDSECRSAAYIAKWSAHEADTRLIRKVMERVKTIAHEIIAGCSDKVELGVE